MRWRAIYRLPACLALLALWVPTWLAMESVTRNSGGRGLTRELVADTLRYALGKGKRLR